MKSHFMSVSYCPYCDYKLDAASNLSNEDDKPEVGDVTVCLSCASVLVFTENLQVRKPNPGEIEMTTALEKVVKAIKSIDRRNMSGPRK